MLLHIFLPFTSRVSNLAGRQISKIGTNQRQIGMTDSKFIKLRLIFGYHDFNMICSVKQLKSELCKIHPVFTIIYE